MNLKALAEYLKKIYSYFALAKAFRMIDNLIFIRLKPLLYFQSSH